jgi:CO/xanthine dehydrogenase Mo-binding subunit
MIRAGDVAERSIGDARSFANDELRIEGRAKVTGAAQYVADCALPDMLWAAFAISPHAHARIIGCDTDEARAIPGVRAVLTSADIGERYFGRALFDWPILATDVVRFAGQYVVAVAAETQEIADAAVRAVNVTYRELDPVFDCALALEPDAPVLHENPERYTFIIPGKRQAVAHRNIQGSARDSRGDVETALATAHRTFEHTFSTPRYAGGAIEPRAAIVWITAAGIVRVLSTNKSPFALRKQLSIATGVPQDSIVVEPISIGGDFGSKGFSLDEFVCYYLAQATGRPVKAVRSYVDELRSTNVRHASTVMLKTGVSVEGDIVAMSGRIVFDGGAYAAAKPIHNLLPTSKAIPDLPYRIPNASWELLSVYTNSVPAGHVRAPGEPQLLFAVESQLDIIATELGIDPLAFRIQNAEPQMVPVLEALRSESGWDAPVHPGRGHGVALSMRHTGGGTTSVTIHPQRNGTLRLETGLADQGGGAFTAIRRVLARTLGVAETWIDVVHLGTDVAGSDPGAGGSRVTHIVGNATIRAGEQLATVLKSFGWDGTPDGFAAQIDDLARSDNPPSFRGAYDSSESDPKQGNTYSGYVIDVSVDRETGQVRVESALLVADLGTVINPIAHRGQIQGGFAFGIGTALIEELIIEDGHIQNLSLADYKLPAMPDLPPLRVVLIEDAVGPGPFGAKSVGELSTSSVGPAIANAVAAACGARVMTLPLTAERVHAALASATDQR